MDITQLSDEQLKSMASQSSAPTAPQSSGGDITKLSDDELKAMASQQPKPFYDAIGASMTPAENEAHPVLGTAEKMLQNVATGGYDLVNGVTFGVPNAILRKNNIEPPKLNVGNPDNRSDQSVADLTEGALGLVGNASNPWVNAAVGKVVDVGGKFIGNTVSKGKQFVEDLVHGPEKAMAAADTEKFALGQKTAQEIEATRKAGQMKIDIAKKNANAASQGYDDLDATLQKQVVKASDKQGQDLQDNLPKIFGQKSAEYAKAQEDIIKALPEERKNIPVDKIVNDMEETLKKFKILKLDKTGILATTEAELTPAEHKVLGIYKDLKGSLEPTTTTSSILGEGGVPITQTTPANGTIHVDDLIKNQKYIEPNYGKPFEADDKLKAEIAKVFSNNVTGAVPELQALRSKYAPFLEWKEAASKSLKPFNSQYDVATGTVAKQGAEQGLDPSGQRLMAKLQQVYESPYGAKVKALNEGIKTTALNKEQAAKAAADGIQKLRNSIAQDVKALRQNRTLSAREIDAKTNQLVAKYKNQQRLAKLGVAGVTLSGSGTLLEYFIRRNAYSGLSGH